MNLIKGIYDANDEQITPLAIMQAIALELKEVNYEKELGNLLLIEPNPERKLKNLDEIELFSYVEDYNLVDYTKLYLKQAILLYEGYIENIANIHIAIGEELGKQYDEKLARHAKRKHHKPFPEYERIKLQDEIQDLKIYTIQHRIILNKKLKDLKAEFVLWNTTLSSATPEMANKLIKKANKALIDEYTRLTATP